MTGIPVTGTVGAGLGDELEATEDTLDTWVAPRRLLNPILIGEAVTLAQPGASGSSLKMVWPPWAFHTGLAQQSPWNGCDPHRVLSPRTHARQHE